MKTRVAIVEDTKELRTTIGEWLSESKDLVLVGSCESTEAALKELPLIKPDIVLVDIKLPGADGIECVRKLKPELPGAQFLMLTVYDDALKIFAALEAGASGYLLKRAKRERLLQAIDEMNSGGSPMSAQIARKVVQSFQRGTPKPDFALSPRETEILKLLAEGLLYREIADNFGSSVYTINAHIRRVYEKLHVHSRSQAVAKFLKL